ncbi:MAG TPA: hypothetical protein VFS30_11605 [Dehalococcoidia bacterium]|nr:hypothetical protein [Dehalococcoidia bacterium]
MSDANPEARSETTRHLPVKTWLFAALLFVFGIRMLTAGDR